MFGYELFFSTTGEPIGKYYGATEQEAISEFRKDSASYRLKHGEDVVWETPKVQRHLITARQVDY